MVLVLFQQQAGEQAFDSPRDRVAKLARSVREFLSHGETDVNPEKIGCHLTGVRPMDKSGSEKILVVESDDILRKSIVTVLSDAGYEVSTDYGDGMESVVAFNPDGMILGANPPQLDCCDLLSEIKASERTHNIRVLMLSPGRVGRADSGSGS
jgi:PleD family two-component response regulator